MPRLFVAITPPEPVCDLLLDTMEGVDGVRWQDADNLHVTLRFVGEVDGAQAEDLALALSSVRAPPFALQIAGVGNFAKSRRGEKRPHALWAALAESAALEALRQKVERACERAGLPREERRFIPHITLARLGSASGDLAGWLSAHARLASEPWTVESFALFESHLTGHGSEYEELVRYPLTG